MPLRARKTVLTIWLVLFIVTFVFCKIVQPPEWPAYPSAFAGWVSVPITLTGLSDLRYYALPLGAAILLLLCAWQPNLHLGTATAGVGRKYWFEVCAVCCVALACLSATVNKTWDVSCGWIFELAASYAWVAILQRVMDLRMVNLAALGAGVIAVGGAIAAIGHRQIMGERFFDMPIGPVTLTAAFGAFWAASSVAWFVSWLMQREKPSVRTAASFLLSLVVAVCGLSLLILADRKGSLIALIAGLGYIFVLAAWSRFKVRVSRGALIGASAGLVGTALAACIYIVSKTIIVPGNSLGFRFVYWRKIFEVLPNQWTLGTGPDTFLFKMTSMMARQRAEMPRVFQGNIDVDAHNEWLQGMFELGVPGGLLYLAIPTLILLMVTLSFVKATEASRKAILLAIGAGIFTIMVTELSSVNLRQPMLSAWYYTLLGFGLAAVKAVPTPKAASAPKRATSTSLRVGLAAAGILLGATIVMDIRSGMAHAKGKALMESNPAEAERFLSLSTHRMRAMRWLGTRYELSLARMAQLRASHPAGTTPPPLAGPDGSPTELGKLVDRTLSGWREITSRCNEYSGASFGIAETLMLAGRMEESCRQLNWNLQNINPYDKMSNALLAAICPISPLEQLQCIRRALREAPWDNILQRRSAISFAEKSVLGEWQPFVAAAREDVAKRTTTEWTDPLSPETLRIEASRLVAEGKFVDAAQVQLAAAHAYDRLQIEGSPRRRPATVEADAHYRAAQFTFYSDPTRYPQASELVGKAEVLAVQGLICDPVSGAKPSDDYVGGQLVPVERPDWSQPIWQFAAMMRLVMMKPLPSITQRVEWSLPPAQRTQQAKMSELGRMCHELAAIFTPMPEAQRPPGFARIVEIAQQFPSPQPQS